MEKIHEARIAKLKGESGRGRERERIRVKESREAMSPPGWALVVLL